MKKCILIFALSRTPWIGGIYYRKNIVNMMLANDKISKQFNIIVLTNKKYRKIFESFGKSIKLELCEDNIGTGKAMMKAMLCCLKNRIKYVFPIMPFSFFKLLRITPVSWIADFQHNHYPEFFDEDEINERNGNFSKIANANNPLILSSYDAKKDFCEFYTRTRDNVHVVHFTSSIEDELQMLTSNKELNVLNKYSLKENKYVAICNQFWKHKNHITVFKAIKLLESENDETVFVFTGEPSDRRNPEYYQELQTLINDESIKSRIKILGFVDRSEQLCLMKNAKYIIQPSLFEGWGTTVEDAKVLNKRVLLSDIGVHYEQQDSNSVIFKALDEKDLAEKIAILNKSDNANLNMIENKTLEYSKSLEKVFR